jgi:hypothetical protein
MRPREAAPGRQYRELRLCQPRTEGKFLSGGYAKHCPNEKHANGIPAELLL